MSAAPIFIRVDGDTVLLTVAAAGAMPERTIALGCEQAEDIGARLLVAADRIFERELREDGGR